MTFPSESEASPDPPGEEQEIMLRLADILPRVPVHLLKAGPHDDASQVKFSVDELAAKIARGRVTVPFKRLSSACPAVFRDSQEFPGEPEIQLPLQKLLEQVGLVAPRAAGGNGVPRDQVAQARAQAERIMEEARQSPTTGAAFTPPREPVRSRPAPEIPAPNPGGIGKAISTARNIFGRFGRGSSGVPAAPVEGSQAEAEPKTVDKAPAEPKPEVTAVAEPAAAAPVEKAPEAGPVAESQISLAVLPIFRLLPGDVLRPGVLPGPDVRIGLPLATIDSQLAGGHVEIPVQEFIAALPEELRHSIHPVAGASVWIPLDEIFQNLPPDHLFYIPPLEHEADKPAEVHASPPTAVPVAGGCDAAPVDGGVKEAAPAEPEVVSDVVAAEAPNTPAESHTAIAEAPRSEAIAEAVPAEVAEPIPAVDEIPRESEKSEPDPEVAREPEAASSSEPEHASPAAEQKENPETVAPEAVAEPEDSPTGEAAAPVEEVKPPSAEPELPESILPQPDAAASATESAPTESVVTSQETAPVVAGTIEPEPSVAAATEAPASRAPWMHGFRVPPPILFREGSPTATMAATPPEPVAPPPAPTPEAKRTADFLASQTGIFAAAAFVQGAAFASEDFPRKPDLDALREFMGSFIEHAGESGQRLAWNRLFTIECEQFHVTAVVRETHFLVALHHDRVLPSVTHDALIAAADDLNRVAG
jgi:hypothetical protein